MTVQKLILGFFNSIIIFFLYFCMLSDPHWHILNLYSHVLHVSYVTSLTAIRAAFWWLHREQLFNLCLLYQAKRLACWRVMGLLKVVDLALFDGGHNPLGSICCSLFVILDTIFLIYFEPFACFTSFSLFIYLYCTYKLYHMH